MKMKALFPLLVLTLAATAQAANPTVLMSRPSRGVSRFDSTAWKQLHYDSAARTLVASVTFTNAHYFSGIEPKHTSRRDFFLPGVNFNAATGAYTLAGHLGEVVALEAGAFKTIEPAVNTRYRILRGSDSARLEVEVFPHAVAGPRWLSVLEPGDAAE